jgi:hypothetical protein
MECSTNDPRCTNIVQTDSDKGWWRRPYVLGLIGVFVVIVLLCSGAIRAAREDAKNRECGFNLKQIAMAIHNYWQAYKTLPPAYLTDPTGKPTLSWRVAVAEFIYYNHDFYKHPDFSKPWNDLENAKCLDPFLLEAFHCPGSSKERDDPRTDYVAVVGPGTLWLGRTPGKVGRESVLLVVEWPRSDIHWAEPRDITVEEFLDYFRSKPKRWDGNHRDCLLYADVSGNVGAIPNNSDPETVRKLLMSDSPPKTAEKK